MSMRWFAILAVASVGLVLAPNATATARGDFTLVAGPKHVSVAAGKQATVTIEVAHGTGFTARVGLTVSGLPKRTSAGFTPLGAGYDPHRTMLVKTSTRTPVGWYSLTITATGGGRTHHAHVTLTVHH
jgi:uncharacterized protein (DUF58 family)